MKSAHAMHAPSLEETHDPADDLVALMAAESAPEHHSSASSMLARVGIAMHKMLETLLPTAASEVEREAMEIANHFSVIDNYLKAQPQIPLNVKSALNGIVMAIQFQDRNTQIMHNVATMLERYRQLLEEVSDSISNLPEITPLQQRTVMEAVEHILSSIRLSDIRDLYLDALSKARLDQHSNDLAPTVEKADHKDIELF